MQPYSDNCFENKTKTKHSEFLREDLENVSFGWKVLRKSSDLKPLLGKKVQDYFTSNKITRVAFTQRSKMLQGRSKEDLMDERFCACPFLIWSNVRLNFDLLKNLFVQVILRILWSGIKSNRLRSYFDPIYRFRNKNILDRVMNTIQV